MVVNMMTTTMVVNMMTTTMVVNMMTTTMVVNMMTTTMVVVVAMVASSSLARILEEGFGDSFPTCAFFFLKWR